MSLKRMAMKMAIAFAAAKGYQAFRDGGGMSGLQRKLGAMQQPGQPGQSGTTGAGGTGGLAGMLGRVGGAGGGSAGGLGSLLGGLAGGGGAAGGTTPGGTGGMGGGLGGLLGGLAAMAGGTAAMGQGASVEAMAERGPSDDDTARAMIRAMAQAVRADGQIDAQERQVLMEMLQDSNDPGDHEAVEAALNEPVDPEGLARDVPKGHEAEVYAAALTAIDPDTAAERDFLSRFSAALDMRPSEVRELHDMAGKPI